MIEMDYGWYLTRTNLTKQQDIDCKLPGNRSGRRRLTTCDE
ncbi:MAG TPA: hypothetical protein VE643_07225 [Nitrososphaeraceae archaeon]|nr:hypothetical protein [Nitrososphaeraceae archaeon]